MAKADEPPRLALTGEWPKGVVPLIYGAGLLAAGLLSGTLWHLLASPPNYTIGDDRGAIITEQGLSQAFAMDIWFVFIAVAFGLGVGIITWWVFRDLGWPMVLVVVGGALLVGWLCWQFGHLLGPRDFVDRIAVANPGDRVPMDLELHSAVLLLVWPMVANVPVVVLSAWNPSVGGHR